MPSLRSSPPPRPARSSPGQSWGTPSKPRTPRGPLIPPLPLTISITSSPVTSLRSPLSPSGNSLGHPASSHPMISPLSSTSSSSLLLPSSPTPQKRVSTPPPRHRNRSDSKLLPPFPLSVETQTSPARVSRRAVAEVHSATSENEDVQIIVSRDFAKSTPRAESRREPVSFDYLSHAEPPRSTSEYHLPGPIPSPRSRERRASASPRLDKQFSSTPPRPARRITSEFVDKDAVNDLLAPQPPFKRSSSPSGSSISTLCDAPTPRAANRPAESESVTPKSSEALASITSLPMGGRKRDSAQRRLSALRGLVANLDFNQPWSISERTEEVDDSDMFWAVSDPASTSEESLPIPQTPQSLSSPLAKLEIGSVSMPINIALGAQARKVSQDHGWPSDYSDHLYAVPYMESTPVRQASLPRKPASTPPRRHRLPRSTSDLQSRTPDPPRPTRQRNEIFDVASSGYSKSLEQSKSNTLPSTPTTTWRSSLSSDETYHRVLHASGPIEVKRQEVMWEMCETEQAFVKSMRTVLRLFAIPLKTPQGKWIDGIPPHISDLFDTLECVAHAHGIVAAAQRDMRRKTDTLDLGTFLAMFKGWVTRLHVHEHYLLRFEAVVQEVEDNVRDPDSVFGEFVRMQMKDEVLGNMSLGSMLLKPVQRLTKYPLFLKRLLDVTPHFHACHTELLALLSSTESIILTLQATKAREEDFEQLQLLDSRLQGLPEGLVLAVRGRKLIGQGQVARVVPGKDLSPSFGGSRARAGSFHSSRGSISSTVSSSAPSAASSSPWDRDSVSFTPSTCRTSAFSISSVSASSDCPPSRSNSITQASLSFPIRPTVMRSPSSASSVLNTDSRSSTSGSLRGKKKDETLNLFIFDDLVIVAGSTGERGLFSGKKRGERSMKVLSEAEGGIGKVLEVKDWSGWQGHGPLFALTILPFSHNVRNPQPPQTTAYTLVANPPTSPHKTNLILKCPTLSSVTSFVSTLAQVTSPHTSTVAAYAGTRLEVEGLEIIGESGEGFAREFNEGLGLGYAQ